MKFEHEIHFSDDIITIHKHDETYFDIILDDFWKYAKENNLNDYCHDFYDPTQENGHGQDCGSLDKEEFFDISYHDMQYYLEDYLSMPKFRKHF
jgi:hypothetical protein